MRDSEKPVKDAVFVVVRKPGEPDTFLAVKRPEDDEDLPGVWGLPATSLDEGESMADGVKRVGREKLGVELAVGDRIGTGTVERDAYVLHGEEYAAEIVSGEPTAPQEGKPGTQYTDWRWTDDPSLLEPAAREGSLCCNIYLDSVGAETHMDLGRSPDAAREGERTMGLFRPAGQPVADAGFPVMARSWRTDRGAEQRRFRIHENGIAGGVDLNHRACQTKQAAVL